MLNGTLSSKWSETIAVRRLSTRSGLIGGTAAHYHMKFLLVLVANCWKAIHLIYHLLSAIPWQVPVHVGLLCPCYLQAEPRDMFHLHR